RVNGVNHTTQMNGITSLYVTLSKADLSSMGEAPITVFTPGPGGGSSAAIYITVYLKLSISATGLTYDPFSRQLYAAVPSGAINYSNSIVSVDPATGAVGTAVSIGNDPRKVIVTSDGKFLYTALNGEFAVQAYDLVGRKLGPKLAMPTSK